MVKPIIWNPMVEKIRDEYRGNRQFFVKEAVKYNLAFAVPVEDKEKIE